MVCSRSCTTDIRRDLEADRPGSGLVILLGCKRHRYLFVINRGLCGGYADSGPVELGAWPFRSRRALAATGKDLAAVEILYFVQRVISTGHTICWGHRDPIANRGHWRMALPFRLYHRGSRRGGAGTVVTNLPPLLICGGVPAKVIGYRQWGG